MNGRTLTETTILRASIGWRVPTVIHIYNSPLKMLVRWSIHSIAPRNTDVLLPWFNLQARPKMEYYHHFLVDPHFTNLLDFEIYAIFWRKTFSDCPASFQTDTMWPNHRLHYRYFHGKCSNIVPPVQNFEARMRFIITCRQTTVVFPAYQILARSSTQTAFTQELLFRRRVIHVDTSQKATILWNYPPYS